MKLVADYVFGSSPSYCTDIQHPTVSSMIAWSSDMSEEQFWRWISAMTYIDNQLWTCSYPEMDEKARELGVQAERHATRKEQKHATATELLKLAESLDDARLRADLVHAILLLQEHCTSSQSPLVPDKPLDPPQ